MTYVIDKCAWALIWTRGITSYLPTCITTDTLLLFLQAALPTEQSESSRKKPALPSRWLVVL